MAKVNSNHGIMTRAIHAGEAPDQVTSASSPPLHMSSAYLSHDLAGFSAHDLTPDTPLTYTRWSNPTVAALEAKIASLQGTEDCICLASGMAAATCIFLSLLSAGDHVIVSDVSYAGVAELARDTLPRLGIEVSIVNMSDTEAVAAALRPNTKLIHSESPANPILRLSDLRAISDIAHSAGALHSTDATFATPIGMDTTALGVDLVMHSITKYICGHGDAMGGAVAGARDIIAKLRAEGAIHHGGVLSPFNAWLIARGLGTLPLRMKAHQENALALATWLSAHPIVTSVTYPGLSSHPQAELAGRQMHNTSGMVTFQVGNVEKGQEVARRMIEKLEIFHYAVSLGHQRSLIYWMETEGLMETSYRLSGSARESYRSYAGDGIFRVSVGLEESEDLIADLDRVL